ncbi:MAG: putative ABC transporter-binding protein [Syntrophomonadaceae bacterium]|nr:putative ABC transporter-binding protein [Bacillota bacterium]
MKRYGILILLGSVALLFYLHTKVDRERYKPVVEKEVAIVIKEGEPVFPEVGIHGGERIVSMIADPATFNPILAMDTASREAFALNFEGLTQRCGITAEIKPHLARSWEISPDGLTYTFFLRDDVYWHDGVPLTADDVVFTFDLIHDPEIPAAARPGLTIEGIPIRPVKIDDSTIQFTLKDPFAPFLSAVGTEIVPKHRLYEIWKRGEFPLVWGLGTSPEELVGTGPFMLYRYIPGEKIVTRKNPDYWKSDADGGKLPYLDRLTTIIVPHIEAALMRFRAGETDVFSLRGIDLPLLYGEQEEDNFTIYFLGPTFSREFMAFNQNNRLHPETGEPFVPLHKQRWFRSRTFRQAILYGIDREGMIEVIHDGQAYVMHSPISPADPFFYNPEVRKFEFSPDKARAALAEIGMSDRDGDGWIEDEYGHKVSFHIMTNAGNELRIQAMGLIKEDLAEIGIEVTIMPIEWGALLGQLDVTWNWDAVVIGITGDIEPHHGKTVFHYGGHLHLWNPRLEHPDNPAQARIAELFEKGARELDREKRRAYYNEFQEIFAEEVNWIPLYHTSMMPAVRNKFGNLYPTSFGGTFHNIEEIFIIP